MGLVWIKRLVIVQLNRVEAWGMVLLLQGWQTCSGGERVYRIDCWKQEYIESRDVPLVVGIPPRLASNGRIVTDRVQVVMHTKATRFRFYLPEL